MHPISRHHASPRLTVAREDMRAPRLLLRLRCIRLRNYLLNLTPRRTDPPEPIQAVASESAHRGYAEPTPHGVEARRRELLIRACAGRAPAPLCHPLRDAREEVVNVARHLAVVADDEATHRLQL